MNKRDDAKLEILSGIDEDIIDKNTKKRNRLFPKAVQRSWKKLYVSIGALAASILLIFGSVFVFLQAMEKQVPVYTGMTVSGENRAATDLGQNDTWNAKKALFGEAQADEIALIQANARLQEDETLTTDATDAESDATEESQTAPSTVTVPETESGQALYYTMPNRDLYITVHVSNPDNFEILSFTLNGKVYSSYMFEDGSDMENLILKVNVGEIEGIVEYTIDAIKYVDGTEIKDVRMEGDRTVRIGVYTEKQPTATVESEAIGLYSVSFDVTSTDEMDLIALSGGKLYAVLYRGQEELARKELAPKSSTAVRFDGLEANSAYRYAVIAEYDALDGTGFHAYVLSEKELLTLAVVQFINVTATQTSITFSFLWESTVTDQTLTAIALYQGDEKIKDVPTDATSIEDLLSNTEYRLVASYEAQGKSEQIEYTVRTLIKSTPTVEIIHPTQTQTSIGFDIAITDTDAVGALTKIELLHGNNAPIVAVTLDVRSFDGLLSNNLYTVRLTYTYDLNDGMGEQTVTVTQDILTLAKAAPTVEIIHPTPTQTSIGFDVAITDPDAVGALTKIELLHGNNAPIVAENLDVRSFDGLFSNNLYTVRLTYTYDLNDGVGEQTVTATQDILTLAKAVPTVEIIDLTQTQTSIGFDVSVTDTDAVGALTKIELLHGNNAPIVAENLDVRSFDGLLSNNLYTVRLTYTYNANDGKGDQLLVTTRSAYTAAQEITVTDIQIVGETSIQPGESISLVFYLNNPDHVTVNTIQINGSSVMLTKVSSVMYTGNYMPTSTGGRVSLQCEVLSYQQGTDTAAQTLSYTKADAFVILGSVSISSLTLEKEYYTQGEEVIATVTFVGSEGYEMKSVRLTEWDYGDEAICALTKISDTVYTFTCPSYFNPFSHSFFCTVSSLVYGIGDNTMTVVLDSECEFVYYVGEKYDTVINISTAEELQNMKSGQAYRLVADIDLNGFDWKPYAFSGMLDGNGYVINNLSVTLTDFEEDTDGYLYLGGLFSSFDGYLHRIVMKNVSIQVITEMLPRYGFQLAVLAGNINNRSSAFFSHCEVEGNISVIYQTRFDNCDIHGIANHGAFYNCSYKGTVSIVQTEGSVDASDFFVDPIGFGKQMGCTYEGSVIVNGKPSGFN